MCRERIVVYLDGSRRKELKRCSKYYRKQKGFLNRWFGIYNGRRDCGQVYRSRKKKYSDTMPPDSGPRSASSRARHGRSRSDRNRSDSLAKEPSASQVYTLLGASMAVPPRINVAQPNRHQERRSSASEQDPFAYQRLADALPNLIHGRSNVSSVQGPRHRPQSYLDAVQPDYNEFIVEDVRNLRPASAGKEPLTIWPEPGAPAQNSRSAPVPTAYFQEYLDAMQSAGPH